MRKPGNAKRSPAAGARQRQGRSAHPRVLHDRQAGFFRAARADLESRPSRAAVELEPQAKAAPAPKKRRTPVPAEPATPTYPMRLNRYLALKATRPAREADTLIEKKMVL